MKTETMIALASLGLGAGAALVAMIRTYNAGIRKRFAAESEFAQVRAEQQHTQARLNAIENHLKKQDEHLERQDGQLETLLAIVSGQFCPEK